MPFDPSQPATGSALDSAVMRSQLTSLKALIDAVLTNLDAQIDTVTTLDPGQPATVSVSVAADTLHFTFGIPRGSGGQPGNPGADGGPGPQGPQGPPFAQALVDAVNTLSPGEPATVSVSFDGSNVHFTFGIPTGPQGPGGAPGEVTNAQLTSAIATTAMNPAGIQPLNISFSNPPTDSELNVVRDKINELITGLFRAP